MRVSTCIRNAYVVICMWVPARIGHTSFKKMTTIFHYHAADTAKLEDAILRAHAQGHKRVVLDLDRVDDLGTAELRGLITLLRRSRQAGGEIVLRTTKGEVIRALRLTALDRLFPVEDRAEAAA